MFPFKATPLEDIHAEIFETSGVRLLVKRDDLLHPDISGNKWRKLKYNLSAARESGFDRLLTFGGAYSNHIAAVAAAGKELGFATVGVIRGEKMEPLNPTLSFAGSCGMELIFVNRTKYRQKEETSFFDELPVDPSQYYLLPEGGSNCLALKGCTEIVEEIVSSLGALPEYICTACGTGATLAGIVSGMKGEGQALGFSVLKGNFMKKEVTGFLRNCKGEVADNWEVDETFHFGGYAKFNPSLIDFINCFRDAYGIPLDPIYTGKLFYGVFEKMKQGYFPTGSTVVLVHTGGLQGIRGFNQRFGTRVNEN